MAKTTPKVRVPEERIKMYTKYAVPPNTHKQYPEGIHKLAGPFDIALIKLKARVTLMPGRVVPVGFLFFFANPGGSNSFSLSALCRLAWAASRTKECRD